MTTLNIAFRNISRQKKRSFLLGGAIAFGMLVITLLMSLTGGMVANVKENFSQILAGHIYIRGSELSESGKTINVIRDDSLLQRIIADLDIKVGYITKRSSAMATLIFGSREMLQGIEGIQWANESFFRDRLLIKEGSLAGLSDPRAIIISSNVGEKLGVEVGETLLARIQTITGQQNVGEFRVIAFSQSTDIIGDFSCYVHGDYLNELINLRPGEFQSFNIFLQNMEEMDVQAKRIYNALSAEAPVYPREEENGEAEDGPEQVHGMFGLMMGGEEEEPWEGTKYSITTLNDLMSHVMDMVNVLNYVGFFVFLILLLITMVGITNTFRMILIERTREIGTIRAIGMQRSGVRNMFLLEALSIAIFGTAAGIALSLALMGLFSFVSFDINNPFFIFLKNGHPTFVPSIAGILGSTVLIGGISLLAAYFPARRAAKLDPAKALGTHY
ncbi:MAG: ABC transporter permease [Spirochaetales bacterium]|nr:ABC transporter permease [Spirochaetales bacterium]